jgi:hypothetical protein
VSEPGEHTEHLPTPSIWPCVAGAGVALLAFGIPTAFAFCALGIVLLAWGLYGWIQDMRHG